MSRSDDEKNQQPPVSQMAERCVLGAMIRDNRCIDDVLLCVRRDDFYYDAHQKVFAAIAELGSVGKPVDLVILAEKLRADGLLDDVGGYVFLAELWDAAPTAANIEHYAKIVRDKAAARAVIHTCNELVRDAFSQAFCADELLEKAERSVLAITSILVPVEGVDMPTAMAQYMLEFDKRTRMGDVRGLSTGMTDLDLVLCGLQNGELTLPAARPGVGKTVFGCNLAANVCRGGRRVMFVSLEMSTSEIVTRLVSNVAGVDSYRMNTNTLNAAEHDRLCEAFNVIGNWKLHIDSTANQSVTRITSAARRQQRKAGLDLLIVDYIQQVEPEDRRVPRHEQIGVISRRLKACARELNIPVVALCQVNRAAEGREERKPRLSDLRESGSLEADADMVLILHPAETTATALPNSNPVQLLNVDVAKNRNGRCGEITLVYEKKFLRLSNYQNEWK